MTALGSSFRSRKRQSELVAGLSLACAAGSGALACPHAAPASVARSSTAILAKALVAPSLGGESFGMVLTRAYACATPVVASDIDGYREVMTKEAAVSFPAGDGRALTEAVVGLLEDEPRRAALGAGARRVAIERYSWGDIGRRLVEIYEQAIAS